VKRRTILIAFITIPLVLEHVIDVGKQYAIRRHKMPFCRKCGAVVQKGGIFCPKCGLKMNAAEGGKEEKAEPEIRTAASKSFLNKRVMAFIALVLVISIVVIIFLLAGRESGSADQRYASGSESSEQGKGILETITEPFEKAYCGDGECESDESSSTCCLDCGCPSGYVCDGNSCKRKAVCGNSECEEGESSSNCCQDCGCPTGQTCDNGACVELKPELDASFRQTTESYSVTYLKAKGSNIGEVTLTNTGNDDASNVKITLSSPNGYFAEKTIAFGTVRRKSPVTETVDLTFLDKALDVTTDEQISIQASIGYSNSANQAYSSKESFDMLIAGRNYMTWSESEMIASWVTPTQPIIREFAAKSTAGLPAGMSSSNPIVQQMAARWLFESMRAYGVKYVNDAHSSADYVQFPYETLKNKAGDCDDNAVLYASLLESIGLKSFLMLVPGHIFSGYVNSAGNSVPIETTSNDFESALASGSYEYNKYKTSHPPIYPTSAWRNYPQVNFPEKEQLLMPSITKQIGKCGISFSFPDLFVASVDVKFVNSGNAPGAGCAAVATYESGQLKDQVYSCWTLNPGETKDVTYQPDISIFGEYTCSAY